MSLSDLTELFQRALVNYTDTATTYKVSEYRSIYVQHMEIPAVLSAAYIAFVFAGQVIMANIKPFDCRQFVKIWNLLLAVFSIVGAFKTVPDALKRAMAAQNWSEELCRGPADEYNGEAGFWIQLFILSKIPELVDTVLLVLQKKPVILLHWYHHFTVMTYCWHAYAVQTKMGTYFAAMNFTVHAIMYSYYFLMCFSAVRPVVRKFNQMITSLQIVQMVFGMMLSSTAIVALHENEPHLRAVTCPGLDYTNTLMAFVMYVSYFVLFSHLYKELYLSKKKK